MRRFSTILLLMLFSLHAFAQSLSVESFRLLENDMAANTQGTMMRDQNGDVAALIRVVTTEKGFVFDGGMMGIVGTKQDIGEILVYVPHGIQKITIKHEQLGVLRDYYFPISIEKARTYELKLVSGRVKTIIEEEQTAQYLVMKVTPSNASVYIDGNLTAVAEDGSASILAKFGAHEYRVEAVGYITDAGQVQVGREKVTKEINLKSAKAELNLTCPTDSATIWLNNKQVGIGTWSGALDPGLYVLEAKLEHHRSRSQTIELSQLEKRTVSLTAPEPMYGKLQIETTPVEVKVYIDGVYEGETPMIKSNILEGTHSIRLEKINYHTYDTEVTINEGQRSDVNVSLSDIFVATINSKPSGANLIIDGKDMGTTPYSKEMSSGEYRIQLRHAGREPYDKVVQLNASNPELSVSLPRRIFKKNEFYANCQYGMNLTTKVNSTIFSVGTYLANVNLELSLLNHQDDGFPMYITKITDNWCYEEIFKAKSSIEGCLGYGIIIGYRLRITPQLGFGVMGINSTNYETFVAYAKGGICMRWAPVNHISLSITPCYDKAVLKGEVLESVSNSSDVLGKYGSGLNIRAGLSVFF